LLRISLGSANELEYYFLLARDLSILARADFEPLTEDLAEVRRMLTGLIQRLRS
jgi:four helix bundle protein